MQVGTNESCERDGYRLGCTTVDNFFTSYEKVQKRRRKLILISIGITVFLASLFVAYAIWFNQAFWGLITEIFQRRY